MHKHLQAKIGITITSVALIFSIFAFSVINGSLAWFANRTQADAQGFSVTAANDLGAKLSIESHPVKKIDGNSYTIEMSQTALELPLYDPENIIPTTYERAIAVIVTIEPLKSTTLSLSLLAATNADSVVSVDNWISNCLSIKQASLNGSTATLISPTTPAQSSFLTVSSNTHQKTLEIPLLRNTSFNETQQLCYIIEYDIALLDYIAGKVLLQNPAADTITYKNDIKFWAYGGSLVAESP